MKLITEIVDQVSAEVIEESANTPKKYKIKGPFIHAEDINRNGRIYKKEYLIPEVDRYIKESVNTNRALGELGHSQNPLLTPDRLSHRITKLFWDGNLCMGEANILNTEPGKILKALIDEGVSFGVSTKGMGSIKESAGHKIVQPDFKLVGIDAVLDPSGIKCFTQGILENKEWIYDTDKGWVESYFVESKKTLQKIKASEVEPMALKIFENFLHNL